jgi:hypothetical protein
MKLIETNSFGYKFETKHQLQYISDDDRNFDQVKIKKVYDFS